MKILVITQEISRQSPVLGFFHGWLAAFSKRFESITAVCLKKGDYDLPANVSVFSLGKEEWTAPVVFGNETVWLLGAITLEHMGLILDPINRKLLSLPLTI